MTARRCPTCRRPVSWEGNRFQPFCSERCKTLDLGAWSAETYRIPQRPEDGQEEGWSDPAAS